MIKDNFRQFPIKLYVAEVILMSTHNLCFYGEISKIIPELSSNTHLICSIGYHTVMFQKYSRPATSKKRVLA